MVDHQPRFIVLAFHLPEALRDLIQGITEYAKQAQRNWEVFRVDLDDYNASFTDRRTDGMILATRPGASDLIKKIQQSGRPAVHLLDDVVPRLPSVLSDDAAIGREAATYLLGCGFRTFAFVGTDTQWSRDRQKGYTRALEAAGFAAPLVTQPFGAADFRFASNVGAIEELRAWVKSLPPNVAVMTACDLISKALLYACEAENIAVPNRVAILGVDNFSSFCELSPVPLSSVAQDFTRIGFEAAAMLDQIMTGGGGSFRNPVLVPPGAVQVRTSTDVLAFEDPIVVMALRTIRNKASTGITVKEVMCQLPISRKWLDHRFREIVGHTASQEIRRCRMQFVRDLLINTSMPVSQIAALCKFSCAENLIRCFRASYGMPPQTYRLKARLRLPTSKEDVVEAPEGPKPKRAKAK